MALLNYAIKYLWREGNERPNWIRQGPFVPCECERCYFCLKGYTSGIAHKMTKTVVIEYK